MNSIIQPLIDKALSEFDQEFIEGIKQTDGSRIYKLGTENIKQFLTQKLQEAYLEGHKKGWVDAILDLQKANQNLVEDLMVNPPE